MEIHELQQLLSEMSLQEKIGTDGAAHRCILR